MDPIEFTSYADSMPQCKGIYVFVMTKQFICKDGFDNCKYAAKIKKNVANVFEKDKILYLGKTDDFHQRMKEHYSDDADKTPYSLKLNCSNRKNEDGKSLSEFCKVILFKLKDDYCKNNFSVVLLPLIEKKLHKELKPLIGSPRI